MKQILLAIQNISKAYNHTLAVKDVSLTIYEGEILGLLGSNGAGKTTLSSLIATLHPPTSGTILYKGTSIYKNVPAYRMNIGFCPQKPNFDSTMTVKENLLFAGRYFGLSYEQTEQRVAFLIQEFGLSAHADKQPDVLSGGYKQRLLIARALVHNPTILILDEPTVALDPHVRRQVWNSIKHLKMLGITVILTTHYLDEAEYLADRVCIMDKGVIKVIDTPENLLSTYGKKTLEEVFIDYMEKQEELS